MCTVINRLFSYTGDFRYSPSMLNCPPLQNKKTIDVLYLDNTNCNPAQKLPSRKEATNQIKEIIEKHPEHDIVIGLYHIGKESLLVDLAKYFKTWVIVTPQRLERLKMLELENVFEIKNGAGRIIAVYLSEITYGNMVRWNRDHSTIAIIPTSRKINPNHKDIHVVPYSDHSSFEELTEFVSRLKPCSIVPLVKTEKCETYFKSYLSATKKHEVTIPETVKAYMKNPNKMAVGLIRYPLRNLIRKRAAKGVETFEDNLPFVVEHQKCSLTLYKEKYSLPRKTMKKKNKKQV
ncbi:5 exonuclease Apollo isoform X1 [Pelobates cultripes]|uniref:5' exonuclease Apollo n=1 Tax=Pelobates cultripes TaxID=61616 RepID=A0AAD1QZU7_PELCU|nr:5 exonuclease Apollo isoform X1 [Pelobates cultripes]